MINLPIESSEAAGRVLSDLHEINNNKKYFMEWLKSECKRLERLNRSERDELQFRWRQGAVQVLGVMIAEIERAKETFKTLQKWP